MNAADPWVITTKERLKYEAQFQGLQPTNGIVTGAQAKGFLLQSQLPPLVLGQIWALADTDADGKMNVNEFSIACKLINLKLRGFEVPKTLPPTLIASLNKVGGTPILTPTSGLSPLDPLKSLAGTLANAGPPQQPAVSHVIPQPIVHPQMPLAQHPIVSAAPPRPMPPQPMIAQQAPSLIPMQPLIPQTGSGVAQPMTIMPQIIPQQAYIPPQAIPVQQQIIQQPVVQTAMPPNLPALPTPPQSGTGTPNRSMSISERAPSIDSPAQIEWAIKGPAKLKYTQLFNTTDRNRTGFLTGPQARNILVQSKLPQAILAQIWALSDMDSDGRLGCEEFVLAMYLCDLGIQGEKIPTVLPPELIPPSFRKSSSRHGSVSGSRHNSVSSQGNVAAESDTMPGILQSAASFEDKRKENFDKGQAELERRRKALLEIQRKEQEERERKEREETEKREKARIEAELKKQQELERELLRQKEMEQEREEQRKRELEKKELARKQLEEQRQKEWEAQKISEMQQQRQREQDNVLKLKAQNQALSVELSTFTERIKELSQKICDTRVGVTNVKTVIDGMRSTRDTQMSDMAQLKAQVKDQNQRLVQLSQEKAKLDAKTKAGENESLQFSNKQIMITQLKDKLENIREKMEAKTMDITHHNEELTEAKSQLSELIRACEELYSEYDIKRIQILEMKNNQKNQSYTSSWDTSNSWPVDNAISATPIPASTKVPVLETPTGYVRYRAIYEFSARNADEISFIPGDIVMVPIEQHSEPGWLSGEINDHRGWFPESYVEKVNEFAADFVREEKPLDKNITQEVQDTSSYVIEAADVENVLPETIPVTDDFQNNNNTNYNDDLEYFVACYAYHSTEIGDLNFDAGETVLVSKKEGEWWTGSIGDRIGIFPSNYVQKIEVTQNESINGNHTTTAQNEDSAETAAPVTHTKELADEARHQADMDSEVSQINTQPSPTPVQNEDMTRYSSMSRNTPSSLRSKKYEVGQVIAPYEATSAEQLSLQRGQMIMIRKKSETGWWEGELQIKGRRRQSGWFPASYIKILQGGRNSGRNTPVSASKIELSETILDKVIALYPYKALNDDELSFEKDDIISVLGRDEPEWWRGELNGTTGLFPSNYVGPFVKSGKKS